MQPKQTVYGRGNKLSQSKTPKNSKEKQITGRIIRDNVTLPEEKEKERNFKKSNTLEHFLKNQRNIIYYYYIPKRERDVLKTDYI